jgi:myosin-crossreactive antigen
MSHIERNPGPRPLREIGNSIRPAQTEVYSLLGLEQKPPAVYKEQYAPRVLLKAFLALHEIGV